MWTILQITGIMMVNFGMPLIETKDFVLRARKIQYIDKNIDQRMKRINKISVSLFYFILFIIIQKLSKRSKRGHYLIILQY